MASEQAHSRPSFLLDPLATDLLSFDEDDTDSTRYDRLCAPMQSATRSDPFLGPPYGDEPSEWHHSPSLANFRLSQPFETNAEQVPAGRSNALSLACLCAEHSRPTRFNVGMNALAGPHLSRTSFTAAPKLLASHSGASKQTLAGPPLPQASYALPHAKPEPLAPSLGDGTHALAGPPLSRASLTAQYATAEPSRSAPGVSSLAGPSLSRAQFDVRRAAAEPPLCFANGATSLAGPSMARAQRVDNVERQPPCSADSVAAFPDKRLPHAHLGDTFVKREPTCPANDDPFAFRARPHATVGAEPDLSSVPFAARFGADARGGEQARDPSPAAPAMEQTPLHATAAQLLQVLLEAARSQPCALVGDPRSPQPSVPSSLRAMRLDDSVMVASVLPVSLTAQAARWYRLVGFQARSMEEFRTLFRSEFLPPDYERRVRRELELRTQHPDESLLECIRALQELYLLADPMAPDTEKVERATRQAHPTFAAYLRSDRYRNLNDLASDAKRIQGDILAAQTYRPPPPPSASLEPRCAWAGGDSSPRNAPEYEVASAAREHRDMQVLSDRALDPYSYARACPAFAPNGQRERDPHAPVHGGKSDRTAPFASERKTPSSRDMPSSPNVDKGVVCYRCHERGHLARSCSSRRPALGPPRPSGNGASRR
ncbi:hypothetical protein HPB50_004047 [Hyalomma asiaticum]|uniref:Uncharacterized protein n=1 Tax=Hyalomma asiaticum TaxID=266040 RepID=A0ACB7SC04_HYAAI|nr:hypothetical protein HPB50_004047 [Hyalomma asiaticum]